MHALRSWRKILTGLGLAAVVIGTLPAPAAAKPHLPLPGGKQLHPLFAKSKAIFAVNRVYCGVINDGRVCTDSSGGGVTESGYWPRGSLDSYIFNSGIQVAGVIEGTKATNPWANDTTGGWFFDGAGGRQQTEGITPAYQSYVADDLANWPADAYVPQGDFVADLYAEPLRGLKAASQGDLHFIAWEGNPQFNRNRLHPLGILVDYRLLAWNYPAGAQDVIFLVATIYNITSANAADYAQHRPAMQSILLAQGQKFQAINNAAFGVTLPTGGYTISPMYIDMAADMDVGDAKNYNGGILPFAMGYTYEYNFGQGTTGDTFDPSIFGPPFFAGIGFVGMKYLKGPNGPGKIQLLTTFCNGQCGGTSGHADPSDEKNNFRTMAGQPNVALGDGPCNIPGDPAVTHMCFMLLGATQSVDTRIMESSDSLSLAPGEAKTIVVAYVLAAPVAIAGFTPGNALPPGNPVWSEYADSIIKYNGLNQVDSVSGFLKYNGPLTDPDGSKHEPVQNDFTVVKGSLLGKALVAQAVFDAQFLQEFSPDAPDFFLIPGDKQVTILWKPSDTETLGDPYYAVVGSPTKLDPATGATIPNPLYDPNYRQFDVEGYRVYRGRSDTPSALKLLAQFDYAGTTFNDYTGTVYNGNCAPELGILTDCPKAFPTAANPIAPGQPYTVFQAYNIGPQSDGTPLRFVDQTSGTRIALVGGSSTLSQVVDTAAVTSGGLSPLGDTGVPFIFIDKTGAAGCLQCGVSNGITYFYTVTAFDVNAPGHGPTTLESAKITKQVTPQAPAGNFTTSASATASGPFGRNGALTDADVPTIDPTTGEFSKKFPPTNAATITVGGLVSQVLQNGSASVILDSVTLATDAAGGNAGSTEWFSVLNGSNPSPHFTVPVTIPFASFTGKTTGASGFQLLAGDSAAAARYGGGSGFIAGTGNITMQTPGDYLTGNMGRGCVNGGASGSTPFGTTGTRQCDYNGPRWFIGDAETVANPNSDNPGNFNSGHLPVTFSNSGGLDGVTKIYRPIEYENTATTFRDVGEALSPFISAADYRVYWGSGGKVDSVIDLTHDVEVPFSPNIEASWGILNGSAVGTGSYDQHAYLSFTDISCVAPFNTAAGPQGQLACNNATASALSQTAVPGPIVICSTGTSYTCNRTAATEPNTGFLFYIKGRIFMMELAGGALPNSGTAWTVRDYTGAILYGNGVAGNYGPYQFNPDTYRPFNAPGVSYKVTVTASSGSVAATGDVLSKVHTVPDPYYVTSAFDRGVGSKDIQFVNVPTGATIRIYTTSGVLIRVLQNTSSSFGGLVHWDVRNRTNQFVASGVYFYNVEAGGVSHTGKMTIINEASTAIQ